MCFCVLLMLVQGKPVLVFRGVDGVEVISSREVEALRLEDGGGEIRGGEIRAGGEGRDAGLEVEV